MGAIFYNFGGGSILKNSIGSGTLSICTAFDTFNNGQNLSIITEAGITVSDTIQFFQSFDDFIHYYYFGKGLGNIVFRMLLFCSCQSTTAPALSQLLTALGGIRGQPVTVSFGNVAFTGVLLEFNITVLAEPETYYDVSITLGMVDHQLPSAQPSASAC